MTPPPIGESEKRTNPRSEPDTTSGSWPHAKECGGTMHPSLPPSSPRPPLNNCQRDTSTRRGLFKPSPSSCANQKRARLRPTTDGAARAINHDARAAAARDIHPRRENHPSLLPNRWKPRPRTSHRANRWTWHMAVSSAMCWRPLNGEFYCTAQLIAICAKSYISPRTW